MSRAFSTSYLAGDAAARALFPRDYRDPADRVARAQEAAQRRVDPALLAVLREQQARLPASAARQASLEALGAGGAAVVVTGQQVGLFLGPLYTLYKAASAIAVAVAIQAESGIPCVPLFWLQTEDHDFAEIAGCTVAGRDGQPVHLALAGERAAQARISVAHRALGDDVTGALDALAEALGPGPAPDEVLALLRAHYLPGRSLAAAFTGVLATLFADDGLLFLDPRDRRVAALAAPIYGASIESSAAIDGRLQERGAWLAAAGFDQQVSVRPGCPLVFFHPGGPDGPRFRLQRRQAPGGGWTLAGGGAEVIADAELQRALDREPLCFSTSALLRPIVQDALLPSVAYVGGPGEINYFAQLGPIYELLGVAPALVVPRARFRCLDARSRRLLAALALAPGDLALPPAELRTRVPAARAAGAPDPAELRRRVAEQITPVVEQLAREVVAFDARLDRPARRAQGSVAHALGRLIDRTATRLAERDETTARRIEHLRGALYPDGVPQERFYGWPSLAGRHGARAFTRLVLDELQATGPFTAAGERDLRP